MQIFAWLPWFTATILDPLEANGFYFNNMDNILNVDCPIMIFHAEDDSVVPYKLGKKVCNRLQLFSYVKLYNLFH